MGGKAPTASFSRLAESPLADRVAVLPILRWHFALSDPAKRALWQVDVGILLQHRLLAVTRTWLSWCLMRRFIPRDIEFLFPQCEMSRIALNDQQCAFRAFLPPISI